MAPLKGYDLRMKLAWDKAKKNLKENPQTSIVHVPRYNLAVTADEVQLMNLLRQRQARYHQVRSLVIDDAEAKAFNIAGVPVTPPSSMDSFHIIMFAHNGLSLDLLIRESDGYYVGWRRTPANRFDVADWYTFKGVKHKLPSYLGKFHESTYICGYDACQLKKIRIGVGMLESIHQFLWNFTAQPNLKIATKEGQIFHYTLMVLLGECQRIPLIRNLVIENYSNEQFVYLSNDHVDIIRHWSGISKSVFQLKLAILEENMGKEKGGNHHLLEGKSMLDAKKNLALLEKQHPLLTFRGENEDWSLASLVGGDSCLTLLNHDEKLVRKIIMRQDKYYGKFDF